MTDIARDFLHGTADVKAIADFLHEPVESRQEGDELLRSLGPLLERLIDGDAIDEDEEIPLETLEELQAQGAFAMPIPTRYGGLGISTRNYFRALSFVGSRCRATALTISCHSSLGATRPLLLFGSEEQRRQILPELTRDALSAFGSAEPDMGWDMSRIATRIYSMPDGGYTINGEKLFITNAPRARYITVCGIESAGEASPQRLRLALVDTRHPGFEVLEECSFMGGRGLSNGWVQLSNVDVPKSHMMWDQGVDEAKILELLSYGWLSIVATARGVAKSSCLGATGWAKKRVSGGKPIAEQPAVRRMLADMVADSFAIESLAELVNTAMERGSPDAVFLAKIAKCFAQERLARVVDDAVQVRGARGLERATSARRREQRRAQLGVGVAEDCMPCERALRDSRMFRIVEGSSEILPQFVAHEAIGICAGDGGPVRSSSREASALAVSAENLRRTFGEGVDRFRDQLGERQNFLNACGAAVGELVASWAVLARIDAMRSQGDLESGSEHAGRRFIDISRNRMDGYLRAAGRDEDLELEAMPSDLLEGNEAWLRRDVSL